MSNPLTLLERALKARIGIAINTDDRVLLRQQLYRARYEANRSEFEELAIVFPDRKGEVWIVKRGIANAHSRKAVKEGNHEPIRGGS